VGLSNWQMTQKTSFAMYNKTGSELEKEILRKSRPRRTCRAAERASCDRQRPGGESGGDGVVAPT
jgi:hypothetical protein